MWEHTNNSFQIKNRQNKKHTHTHMYIFGNVNLLRICKYAFQIDKKSLPFHLNKDTKLSLVYGFRGGKKIERET